MDNCHTTSLPLVAAYNGCNDNNFHRDNHDGVYAAINCTHDAVQHGNTQQSNDAHSIRTGMSISGSENRLGDQIKANNTDALIRDTGNVTNNNISHNAFETRSKMDLNTRDIFNVEKSVLKENCQTRELVAKSTADILLEQCKEHANTRMESARQFATLERQACEDKAQVLAAIAACCCEQKALTIKEASDTRQLINGNTINALQTELSEARLQAAISGISRGKGHGNNE